MIDNNQWERVEPLNSDSDTQDTTPSTVGRQLESPWWQGLPKEELETKFSAEMSEHFARMGGITSRHRLESDSLLAVSEATSESVSPPNNRHVRREYYIPDIGFSRFTNYATASVVEGSSSTYFIDEEGELRVGRIDTKHLRIMDEGITFTTHHEDEVLDIGFDKPGELAYIKGNIGTKHVFFLFNDLKKLKEAGGTLTVRNCIGTFDKEKDIFTFQSTEEDIPFLSVNGSVDQVQVVDKLFPPELQKDFYEAPSELDSSWKNANVSHILGIRFYRERKAS